MEEFAAELMSKLDNKVSFTIPYAGGIPVPESVVVTWVIMGIIMILTLVFVRNLKLVPTGTQNYVESLVEFLNHFFLDIMGNNGRPYLAFLGTIAIYIAFSNLCGVFGLTSPTKDLNVTAALAFMAIFVIELSGIRKRGWKGYFKSFMEPIPLLLPINILEIAIRPLSLCMRLYGNVLGSFIVMEMLKILVPVFIPVIFGFYFDIFDGLIQTYIFIFLTSLFMSHKMEEEEEHEA